MEPSRAVCWPLQEFEVVHCCCHGHRDTPAHGSSKRQHVGADNKPIGRHGTPNLISPETALVPAPRREQAELNHP